MADSQFLFISLCATIVGWLTIYFAPDRFKGKATIGFVFINAILTSIPAIHVLTSGKIEILLSGISLIGEIPIRIDSLSAWFILIINFTGITGVFYGLGYMKSYSDQKPNLTLHWLLYLLFHSSMLWVCMVQNSIVFLIVWELMSLSSLFLVIFDHQNSKTLKAGLNYLVQMHIGVALLTVAFIWVYLSTGSLDFAAIAQFFQTHSNIWLFLLFFIGFGIKAGFIPFHSWLPHAHPAAPSHISGVMSGVIVKLGIYGIFRMITFLQTDFLILGELILGVSVMTGLYGIINSAVHRDFKKMLAYCTIENIGIIGIGIGLGLIGLGNGNNILVILGFGGALLHTLNHSLFKSLLFFSAGSVYQQTHTRDMEKLGGLIRNMPQTAFLFLIGALAIGGLPPFNGFVSEFILYKGMLEGISSSNMYHVILIIIAFAGLSTMGGLSILVFTKSFGTIFLGSPRTELHHTPAEVSLLMRVPQFV
ncbi:MAG: proton-conducting transporter membrane subunit, partial [Bacteroidales bacterium]|nr:proton-conducting transporter membrane subunit [Bacteroidales bacterium]